MAVTVFFKKDTQSIKPWQDTARIVFTNSQRTNKTLIDKVLSIVTYSTHIGWTEDKEWDGALIYNVVGLNITKDKYQYIKTLLMDYDIYSELEII